MATAGFDVLVTVDQNIRYQQNLGSAGVGLVVMQAASNRYVDLAPLANEVLEALRAIHPGDTIVVGAPAPQN